MTRKRRERRDQLPGMTPEVKEVVEGNGSHVIRMPQLVSPPPESNDGMLHVDVHLTREQSRAIRCMRLGLKTEKATCYTVGGRERLVDSPADVVRWLLEQV